ncbi:MAG TPA: methylmalonyl-CoA mutase family protein, partial [Caldimonas sp.]
MNRPPGSHLLAGAESAAARWQREYRAGVGTDRDVVANVSGIPIRPLYTAADRDGSDDALGYPGQPDYTRGVYATMHRGRTWTQRQLVGLGTPADYNARLRGLLARGATAVSLIPCNSVYRGLDMDAVDLELLGTCGTVVDNADHMARCLDGVDLAEISCAMNDPSPFTLFAFMLVAAERRGIDWKKIAGTSNQSDYLSHYVANHMFYRLALPGARRVLVDHIGWCREHVPRWNPMSVVGQHMQQAGATPAEAMAFTLASALQNAEDCIARGMDPDEFLPRFTFFFDISLSFFEEIAKFRAGRRIWSRLARQRLGAKDEKSWRFKFHAQTSG